MEEYKFTTKVSRNGYLKKALDEKFWNKEVEVVIIPKHQDKKKSSAKNFIDKWAGVLQEADTENAKLEHLLNKQSKL